MPYLGSTPTTQSFISGTDYFNGTGAQTAFTLTRTVASVNDIQVTVNNVVQQPNSGYTLSGTTLTFDQAPSAGTNNVYVRYLSTTTQAITPSQNTVGWNTLDSNVQGDLGISFKNRIINSNMVISQRNGTSSVTITDVSNLTYTLDRWAVFGSLASKFSVQQISDAPVGFSNSLRATSLDATSLVTNSQYTISQAIEGFNTADLSWGTANAKTVTLSFWVKSSLTGTFGGVFVNSDLSRGYGFTYTINAANTWEFKTITIPGDTSGTWVGATNGVGIRVYFSLGEGSLYDAPVGTWSNGSYRGAVGGGSVVSTNGATWQLTGVQLEVGTQATAFTLAGGSYGAELALCQRYAIVYGREQLYNQIGVTGFAYSTVNGDIPVPVPVQMRTVPSLTASGSFQISDGTVGTAVTALLIAPAQNSSLIISTRFTVASGATVFRPYRLEAANSATAFVLYSAEL